MSSEFLHEIVEMIDTDAHLRPSPMEFEMAYQARVAIERIKFAIKHAEQFSNPCEPMREASLALLEALDRLEGVERRFQLHTRIRGHSQSGNAESSVQNAANGQTRKSFSQRAV